MKILITGSHFTPAQAVIEQLKKNPEMEIVYIGRKSTREGDYTPSVESVVLPKLGVKFIPIMTGRLQRSFTVYTIPSLLKIPIGLVQSLYLLVRENPDVVVSFGGYVGVPVIVMAWLLSKPIMIHEQTIVSGLASEIGSLFADKIALSFEDAKKTNGGKYVVTGNPLRKEILEGSEGSLKLREFLAHQQKSKLPLVVITGGNQGSHLINQRIEEILPDLTRLACVVHQTGNSKFADFDQLQKKRSELSNPQNYLVTEWIDAADWAVLLRNASLFVSRAGINTLLELAFFTVPVLLIPLPNLSKNEQGVNAQFFQDAGLAEVIPQGQLTAQALLDKMKLMIKDLKSLKERAMGAKKIVVESATQRLALEIILLGNKKA